MQLHDLAAASNAVSGTRRRLEKISELGQLLQRLLPEEIPIAVAYLSGSLSQGRIGVGWSVFRPIEPMAIYPTMTGCDAPQPRL